MASKRSHITQKTKNILFGKSGNKCAHPKCTVSLIQNATEGSEAHILGQICHIHAVSEDGPRGKPGLTPQELNSPENLILLCPNHHSEVDGQHENYPPQLLKKWKRDHEEKIEKMKKLLDTDLIGIQADFSHLYFPVALVDQKIMEELEKLLKSRFFQEFDTKSSSMILGRCLNERELSGGSDELRSRGLAWCARLLSRSGVLDKAEEFLEIAKTLGDVPEIQIAEAFLLSQKGDRAEALQALTVIDSDVSRSAGLMIVAHHDRAEGAVQWMKDVGYTTGNLDIDGKVSLLNYQFQLGDWDAAVQIANSFSESDFEKAPILHHLAALAKLIIAVPADFRTIVLKQIPFEVAVFPLASNAVAMNARRAAHRHFLNGVEAARQLACPRIASMDDEYALWLELRDPAQSAHGKNRLKEKLDNPKTALSFVRYALQFGIKLDLDEVERKIEKNIAISGGMTIDAAIARLTLIFAKSTPEEKANYIARYHKQLAAYFDPTRMQFLQIEILLCAGLIEKANAVLGQFHEEGIPADQENKLQQIISDAQENDPIEPYKIRYRSKGTLDDLIILVTELEKHHYWNDLCEFGRLLFKETHSLEDAERLVNAFNNTHRSEELVEFLKENADLLTQSRHLQMSYAWGLYSEGALLESRTALMQLSKDEADPHYRALQVKLGIAMGDWASLSAYITSEYKNRNNRSAHDLIDTAKLAIHIGSPHARDFVFKAAAKANDNDDASILAGAYYAAMIAGWEDDPKVSRWLERAAELSSEDGPLQRMSFKDILDWKPEWDHRASDTGRLLAEGQIPIFIAAQSLNRTLIDFTAFRALANLFETDPRYRDIIPAYSGKRVPQQFDLSGKTVALDATALLTLSFLEIIDTVLDAFETVCIPHSTLGWLFEERQKVTFHQPSQIKNAHKVRHFLATNVLEKFAPSTVANSELSVQVGDELASLIAEAEKIREGDDTQHIVVRSSPVYRLSSLMREEADLSVHATVLSSCLAVVAKLRQKGQITANEGKRACAYLQLHEKPWPNQPEIADGATLYLDNLAITYLLHLGLLEKLKSAGLKGVASPEEVSKADKLIAYEHISDKVKYIIERLRASLNLRIESGKIRVGGRQRIDEDEYKSTLEHPTASIITLASHCDVVIVDDRFINQHATVDSDGMQAPILSTLDLLDAFVSTDVISDKDRLEYRTKLHRAGYCFVPVGKNELEQCLNASDIVADRVSETAELKAIRENMLCVRMNNWLQLPEEAPWLDSTLKIFTQVLKSLWRDGADLSVTKARSDWILNQIDVRGWAHSLGPENGDNVVRLGRGIHILQLILPINASKKVRNAYLNWVEDRILIPIKEQFPDLYSWIIEQQRMWVAEVAETQLTQEETT